MEEDERVVYFFLDLGLSEKRERTLLNISKIEKTEKKQMRKIVDIFDDEEEELEEYEDVFYDLLIYPPGSNPPSLEKQPSYGEKSWQ